MTRLLPALVALVLILAAAPAPAQTSSATPAGRVEAMVAPVALYPDALLTPLLMAATYPAEIAEAQQWLKPESNARLRGDALVAALEPRPWAPSVKALVPFPETLAMLATRPDWTDQLGKAFAADPALVMATVQKLRHQAVATGALKSSPRLLVQTQGAAIVIAPADPAAVYVPVYNPALVYGAWPFPNFPPKFIEPPPGFRASGADIETGIGFSVGFGTIAPLWGWAHPAWDSGKVEIDIAAYNRINRYGPHVSAETWRYEPHPTGYFHITAAQVAPPAPPPRKSAAAARQRAEHRTIHAAKGHAARHAAQQARREHRRAASSAHRGKLHVAADRHADRHRR
jgi:hypothetical protein